MRGGVSRTSGAFNLNYEYVIASLPSQIISQIANDSNMNATGRASNGGFSEWTVTGTSDTKGRINVIIGAGKDNTDNTKSWASTPACFGFI